jgi:hypothetical protein
LPRSCPVSPHRRRETGQGADKSMNRRSPLWPVSRRRRAHPVCPSSQIFRCCVRLPPGRQGERRGCTLGPPALSCSASRNY